MAAIGVWVDRFHLNQLLDVLFFSLMAWMFWYCNCRELSLFCYWMENGSPVEHFMRILSLKKGTAESIYSTLIDWLMEKNAQCRKLVSECLRERNLEFKHDWKRMIRMLSSSTAIVIDYIWQLFKLQVVHKVITYIYTSLSRNSSIASQRDVKASMRCRKYLTSPSWKCGTY